VKEAHLQLLHANPQQITAHVGVRYHILSIRRLARDVFIVDAYHVTDNKPGQVSKQWVNIHNND